jgi:hypothetical protein
MEEKILKFAGIVFFLMIALTIAAFFTGTMLWLTYDHIHAFFPTAAERGIIAKELGWWDSVCVAWIFGCLIKSCTYRKETKDD